MAKNQMKTLMQGAFVLTLASFIAKLLSAVYRVPFQNLVGDEGFYVYQQVYPIYGMAMTLALSSLPQFISKIIAGQKEPKIQQRLLAELYPLVSWLSLLLWGVIFFFSGFIARLMGDSALQPLLQVVSFAFLLIPPLAFYRGNFQGNLLMTPSAISQVVEQILRVSVILLAAGLYQFWELNVYQVGTLAMTGAFIGGLVAWLLLGRYDQKIYGIRHRFSKPSLKLVKNSKMVRKLAVEGGLLTIYSGLLILFQLIDSFFILNALEFGGMDSQTARIAKGVFDRGQPLVQLGLVVATALSATFLPALTKNLIEEKGQQFLNSAKIYLRLTVGLGLAASAGLAFLLPYINLALFRDAEGLVPLTLFVCSIALTATIQAYQNIAQSQNKFRRSLKAAGWGLLFKLLLTGPLTILFDTSGASLATLIGLTGILVYLIRQENAAINRFWTDGSYGWKLLGATSGMLMGLLAIFAIITHFNGPVEHRMQALFFSLLGVGIGGTIFIQLAIRFRLLTIREWLMLPFGKKILRFMGGK